jgi:uncharacterized DUF497 family protein
MIFEWDENKAAREREKASRCIRGRRPFDGGAPEITAGYTMKGRLVFVSHCERGRRIRIIGAAWRREPSENNMKKESAAKRSDDLRPQYDLSQLKDGVRGKYHRRAAAGTNLVIIEPDLAILFPDSEAVNRALRVIADAAQTAAASKRRRRA